MKTWQPRPYQETLITSVIGSFAKHKTVLLAGCPNSGKTSMTIDLIGRLVVAGRVKRVLVLAHGTKVLRRQFLDEVKKLRPDLLPVIDVCIPQELHRKAIDRYDLVVVDEAHQFYGLGEAGDGKNQKMMKTILGKAKAKNVLLLTGSPARFIAQGFKADDNMFCFSLEQLYAQQKDAVADVMIECASSHYAIKDEDYNNTFGEFRKDIFLGEKETKATLDDVLKILKARLELSGDKLDGFLGKLRFKSVKAGWNVALGRMQKTILAVPSIEVAKQAGRYFTAARVKCLVSHSEDDVESENIKQFKTDKDVLLLVVVNRAQLGFDHRELFNFIDMTGSKSPDRIYQMLCRVVRSSEENPRRNKLFVKVMPRIFSEIQVRGFMSGVMSLSRQENFEKWNGKGLSLIDVPVVRERGPRCPQRKRHVAGERCQKCGFTKCSELHVIGVQCKVCGKTKTQPVPILEPGMLIFGDYFKALEHDPDDPFCPYAMAKLGGVLGVRVNDAEERKLGILQAFERTGRWPSISLNKYVYQSFVSYLRPGSGTYDVQFASEVQRLGYVGLEGRVEAKKREILEFFRKHQRFPPRTSYPTKKGKLGQALAGYTDKDHASYDAQFTETVRSLGWISFTEKISSRKADVVAFFTQHGHWPRGTSEDPQERGLSMFLSEQIGVDPDFRAQVSGLGWVPHKGKSERSKRLILDFYDTEHRLPKEGEALYARMRGFCNKSQPTYDPGFREQVEALGYGMNSSKGIAAVERVKLKQEAIVDFFRAHNRWPVQASEDPDECVLGRALMNYVRKLSKSYLPDFEVRVRAMGWQTTSERVDAKKRSIVQFFKANCRWPSEYSDDRQESTLASSLSGYTRRHKTYDPDFHAECAKLDPGRFGKQWQRAA